MFLEVLSRPEMQEGGELTLDNKVIKCPDCGEDVIVDEKSEIGDIIECSNCGAEMEIVSLNPLEVSLIEEEK